MCRQLLVALVDDSLRAVPAAEAAVIVTENLMLMPQRPAPLTIAPAAAFCFTLGALRGQRNDKVFVSFMHLFDSVRTNVLVLLCHHDNTK